MTADEILDVVSGAKSAKGHDLEVAAEAACDLGMDGLLTTPLIEAIFRLYERLNDPPQSFFNALEMAADEEDSEIALRAQARASVRRAPNYTNVQFLGTTEDDVAVLRWMLDADLDSLVADWVSAEEVREMAASRLDEAS